MGSLLCFIAGMFCLWMAVVDDKPLLLFIGLLALGGACL